MSDQQEGIDQSSRRGFLARAAAAGALLGAAPLAAAEPPSRNGKPYMKLSLAGYSFSRLLPRRSEPPVAIQRRRAGRILLSGGHIRRR